MSALHDPYARLWDEVQAVRVTLAARGLADWAERLDEGMTIAGDPGDVWPQTRRALEALRRSGVAPDLDRRVDACVVVLGG